MSCSDEFSVTQIQDKMVHFSSTKAGALKAYMRPDYLELIFENEKNKETLYFRFIPYSLFANK